MFNTINTIGLDIVEIERFKHWHSYKLSTLKKVFTNNEIMYCLRISTKSAERFAARFAAKEALFKALTPHFAEPINLLEFLKHIEIVGIPPKAIISQKLNQKALSLSNYKISLSITHTRTVACAALVLIASK